MKIAVVYNRESEDVINFFGVPNREKYGKTAIKRISDALKKGGHQVETFEGDKRLIDKLEKYMPRVLKGEIPGLVFNISYGIQGQARYTHVPSILEMVGIPYVGSGPLAHSLALDKVVAKMIFVQNGLSTPDFAVLKSSDFTMPDMEFPLIVKPKNEAVSFGLRIVHSETELREAAGVIFNEYDQAVLAEQYIAGREINVGLLGNNPPETLPPAEIIFEGDGPNIYTYEDKTKRSNRTVFPQCPADISPETAEQAEELALQAFSALGCFDCARVDMRMDHEGKLYILEINSLPSLGVGGSYVAAARDIGLDFEGLVNRLVEVASARYFGTPTPPKLTTGMKRDDREASFLFLTQRRDRVEKSLAEWCSIKSRSNDSIGIRQAAMKLVGSMTELKIKPVEEFTDNRFSWMWETKKGFRGGTLIIGHLDVPVLDDTPLQMFRKDPEYLYGEGIGVSRGPLVMLEFALRALRSQKSLDRTPLGVLYYSDEGLGAQYSEKTISDAAQQAARVLVLRPGNPGDLVISQRRGLMKFRLVVEGRSLKLGQTGKNVQPLLWLSEKLKELTVLSSRSRRLALSVYDIHTDAFPLRLPHRVRATIAVSYYDQKALSEILSAMRNTLGRKSEGLTWELEEESNRPPMKDRRINRSLQKAIGSVAEQWEMPFDVTSSLLPSVAGLVPSVTPVICGMGPVAENIYTPAESISRISLIQRTLLLTQFLLTTLD